MTALRVSHLSDARQLADGINRALRRTDALGLSSDQATALFDRPLSVTGSYQIAGIQVLGPRITGWAADTGTASKAANATYAAGTGLTYSAAYTQSELTATGTRIATVETALQNATQELKAVKDALLTHGLIGA